MGVVHVKGVNFTKQDNPKSTNIIDAGIWGGKVRVQIDNYVTDATEDAGSTIKMGRLPVGATVLEMILYHGALGATVTFDIGDENDVDRYADALDVAAAGVKETRSTDLGQTYKVLGAAKTGDGKDDQNILITTGVATLATGIAVQLITIYARE